MAKGNGGGGNGGGGDRGGGDKGGGDKGDKGDKGGHADKGDRGDRGKGTEVASRGQDVNVGVSRDSGRGREMSEGRNDRGRDFGRSFADRNDRSRELGDRRDSDRRESGKNTLGNLNAAHASATARANASPNSMVGRIAAYETQMNAALAIEDRSARNAAIVAAREQLAQSANKPLTERNIARVDDMLGIRGASSRLGAERRDFDRRDFDRRDFTRASFDRRDFDRRDLDRRDRAFLRDLFDDRRDGRHSHRDGLGFGLGRGLGFGDLPVDPARIEARAAALDARGDRRAAEIRAAGDRLAASIVSRAEARAADLRAREATAKDPARLEARAVDLVAKANALAAEIVARADRRANALTERVDNRVEAIQAIAAYDRAVIAALEITDPTAQATAIAAARADLRAAIDRPLSGRTIDRLGLEGTPTAVASTGMKSSGVDG